MTFVVGLTGGIAAGKTTVARLFEQLGVPCIDADHIAKTLVKKETPLFAKIISHFGKEMLLPTGDLDRKKLGKFIFENKKGKNWLENLLHPYILKEIKKEIALTHSPYIIVVIPLLFEKGPFEFIDRILVVDVPEETQLNRLMQRDHLSEMEAKHRMSHQINRKTRIKLAEDTIINNASEEALFQQVQKLHRDYLRFSHK